MHELVTEGEARRLAQTGNQETPTASRSDQDMGSKSRDQGQAAFTGSAEAD